MGQKNWGRKILGRKIWGRKIFGAGAENFVQNFKRICLATIMMFLRTIFVFQQDASPQVA